MVVNNFLPAFKSILSRKFYSTLIVLSFTLGISSWLLTVLWIEAEKKELGAGDNRFYMYRVGYLSKESSEFWQDSSGIFHHRLFPETPYLLASELRTRFKDSVAIARFGYNKDKIVSSGYSARLEKRFAYSDIDFLKFFKFKYVYGDSARFASDSKSVIITQSASKYYFGDANPMGRQITVDSKEQYLVAAVIRDISPYLGIQFEFLAHITNLEDLTDYNNWNLNTVNTFVGFSQLKVNSDVYKTVIETMNKHVPEFGYKFRLFKPGRINQYSEIRADLSLGSDFQLFSVFSVTSLLVLLIACFNYLIISLGGFTTRAKEIAVRKSFGASRTDIVLQFLIEGLLLSFVSLIAALILTALILNWFSSQTMVNIELNMLFTPKVILNGILISFVTGMAAGSYPAFYFSSLSPLHILSTSLKSGMRSMKFSVLITLFQFTISLMLVFFVFRVEKQLTFMHNSKVGFESSYSIEIPLTANIASKYIDFSKKLKESPEIIGVNIINRGTGSDTLQSNIQGIENFLQKTIHITLKPKHIAESIDYVGAIWNEYEQDNTFEYEIKDLEMSKEFIRDTIIRRVFGIFTVITGFIALLGLYCYSSYITSQQSGEIAVRKTFGATWFSIYLKFVRHFMTIYSVSIIMAIALVILFANIWLNSFIRRIGDFGVEEYYLPGILSFLVILTTISFNAIKASRKPPIEVLSKK